MSASESRVVHSAQVVEVDCPHCEETFFAATHATTQLFPDPGTRTRVEIGLAFGFFRDRTLAETEIKITSPVADLRNPRHVAAGNRTYRIDRLGQALEQLRAVPVDDNPGDALERPIALIERVVRDLENERRREEGE